MASFYIWITVFVICILLICASAVSKITYDRRRATRTVVSRQVDVETIHNGNNTVIYTIPATQMGSRTGATALVYPERTMTVTRSRTTHVSERDDRPPSYDQVVVSPPQNQQPVGHAGGARIIVV